MQNGESGKFEAGFWEKFKKWVEKYARYYSDAEFRKKIAKFAKKGRKVAKKAAKAAGTPALTLYFAAQDKDTPKWASAIMIGALGYFISLVDAIPDFTPVAGYTDDLWVLSVATVVVAAHIKPEHIEKAKETLSRWFGEDS